MSSFDKLPGLLEKIYAAAEEPEAWEDALSGIVTTVDVMGVNFFINFGSSSPDGIALTSGMDLQTLQRYNEYYFKIDPMVRASFEFPLGVFLSSEYLFSEAEYTNTEFYEDLNRPAGIHHIFGTTLARSSSSYAALSMIQPRGVGTLQGDKLELFLQLIPHLQRSIHVYERLHQAERQLAYFEEVVERITCGVIFVDAGGHVVHANAAAQAMALETDGLSFDRDCVQGALSDDTKALRKMVIQTIETAIGKGVSCSEGIVLSRPSGKRPYQVVAAPLGGEQHERCSCRALAALFVTDPEAKPAIPEHLARVLYGLTPAEIRVAESLLQGAKPKEISDRYGVSIATVRTHLRSIFDKTETRRQSELVELLLRGPMGRIFEA
jgi:DNA-binding CsgD family transcriptional regulator